MEYSVKFNLTSRYEETTEADIQELIQKLVVWGELIQKEINNSNRHVGLHFTCEGINVRQEIETPSE